MRVLKAKKNQFTILYSPSKLFVICHILHNIRVKILDNLTDHLCFSVQKKNIITIKELLFENKSLLKKEGLKKIRKEKSGAESLFIKLNIELMDITKVESENVRLGK